MSETDLITRARQGDEGAMSALYARHAPALYRLAFGLLRDRQDAEEVAQDALAYALGRLERYDARRATLRTWLHTITVSRCRNKRRRRWCAASGSPIGWGAGTTCPTTPAAGQKPPC